MTFRGYAPAFRFARYRRGAGPMLQRRCACGGRAESSGECTQCAEKEAVFQRKSRAGGHAEAPSSVFDALRGSSAPLENTSRRDMESHFGYDFSSVRIHTSPEAARSVEATNAEAYTVGRDIVFAPGRYAPETVAGRRLLAHELTHVVQQDSATPVSADAITMGSSEHEAGADEAASAIVDGGENVAGVEPAATTTLQRQAANTGTAPTAGATQPAQAPCLEEVVGEDIPSLLQAGAVTIIEFGAPWCGPCQQNKRGLEAICRRFQTQPPPVTVRFYSIDVDAPGNEEPSRPYAPRNIPHLYFYVGSTEKAHYNTGIEPDRMAQLLDEQVRYASTSGAARGALAGMGWGALAGGLAGIGGAIGFGLASGAEGNALMGGILGIVAGGAAVGLGLGAAIGAIAGAVTDDRKRVPKDQRRRRFQPKSRSNSDDDPQEREADEWAVRVTSGSHPLDASTRGTMERQFGHDFGHVRIHRDEHAESLTRERNAYAVTEGSDIHFASDGYAPSTTFGRAILAHELAHVAQNQSSAPAASVSTLESEADAAVHSLNSGSPVDVQHGSGGQPLALTRGEKTAAGVAIGGGAAGAAGALIGLGVASQMSGTPYLTGLAVGGLIGIGVGALVGGLIGFFARRTQAVESGEAELAIRRRFGAYLPGGVGPLNNSLIRPVSHAELCTWKRCRYGDEAPCGDLLGWTDVGREPPNQIDSAADEPVCANGQKIEHATPARPVIYFDRDRRDAGLIVHEGLHAYTHPSFQTMMRNEATEGITEYFTRQILSDLNIERGNIYPEVTAEAERLVPLVGEEKLKRAYFMGEMDTLSQAADQVMGRCSLIEWALAVQLWRFDRNRPRQIVEGRNQNYCGDESSSAAPVAAPPAEGSTV